MFVETRIRKKEEALLNTILAQMKVHMNDNGSKVEKIIIRLEQSDVQTKGIGRFYEEVVAGVRYDFLKDGELVFEDTFELHTMPWNYDLMRRVTPSLMNSVSQNISERLFLSDKPTSVYEDIGAGHTIGTHTVTSHLFIQVISRPERLYIKM